MGGWVKLHRCLINKPIFDNANLLKVWIWCLCKATHSEHDQLVGLQVVKLQPGQFIFGRIKAAEELNIPQSTVWRLITFLKKNESLDIKTNNKYSLITIDNWASYQADADKMDIKTDNNRTSSEQQMDTNKKDKKVKENIYTDVFEKFFSEYPKGGQTLKPQTFKNFQSLIKKKVNPDDLIQAAKNYATDCKVAEVQPPYFKKSSNFLGKDAAYLNYVNSEWIPAKPKFYSQNKQPEERRELPEY